MSLRRPSLLTLLTKLQRAGLSYEMLATLVAACDRGYTGRLIVHVHQGTLRRIDVPQAQPNLSLTK